MGHQWSVLIVRAIMNARRLVAVALNTTMSSGSRWFICSGTGHLARECKKPMMKNELNDEGADKLMEQENRRSA